MNLNLNLPKQLVIEVMGLLKEKKFDFLQKNNEGKFAIDCFLEKIFLLKWNDLIYEIIRMGFTSLISESTKKYFFQLANSCYDKFVLKIIFEIIGDDPNIHNEIGETLFMKSVNNVILFFYIIEEYKEKINVNAQDKNGEID